MQLNSGRHVPALERLQLSSFIGRTVAGERGSACCLRCGAISLTKSKPGTALCFYTSATYEATRTKSLVNERSSPIHTDKFMPCIRYQPYHVENCRHLYLIVFVVNMLSEVQIDERFIDMCGVVHVRLAETHGGEDISKLI